MPVRWPAAEREGGEGQGRSTHRTHSPPFSSFPRRQTIDLRVAMACAGCEGAVRRVLEATPGVEKVAIDLAAQKVSVATTSLTADDVLAAARKSGKQADLWTG